MAEENTYVKPDKIANLQKDIEDFRKKYRVRHGGNYWGNTVLIYLGILLSASVTIAGIFNQGIIGAILGVIISALITIQNAFPISGKAEFYRILMSEAENLLIDIKFDEMTQVKFNEIKDKFKTLNKYAAAKLPRGEGMEAVRDMYKDLQSSVK